MKNCVLAAAILVSAAGSASAQLIEHITATTNLPRFATYIENTVNGQGLPRNLPALSGFHDPSGPSNVWVTLASNGPGYVDFDLHGLYEVAGFTFWNANSGGPGPGGTGGLKDVVFQYATELPLFTEIPGAPMVFLQVASYGAEGHSYSFAPVEARFIRMNIRTGYGHVTHGFSEIQFRSVPGPGVLSLFGATALLGVRRRRGV